MARGCQELSGPFTCDIQVHLVVHQVGVDVAQEVAVHAAAVAPALRRVEGGVDVAGGVEIGRAHV